MKFMEMIKEANKEWKLTNPVSKTKKYLVIDYEGATGNFAYNVGLVVCDKTKTYLEESYIFQYNNKEVNGKVVSITEFAKELFTIIDRYSIKVIYAYNVAADKALTKKVIGKELFDELEETVKWYDIINEIWTAKLDCKKYSNWCVKNNQMTEKGNVSSTMEVVYRYLKNDLNFQEAHIGIEDARKEVEILQIALKAKKPRQKAKSGAGIYHHLNGNVVK